MARLPLPKLTPAARYWQIVALLLVILPQIDRLPAWLPILLLVFGVIRSPWFEGRFGLLGKWWRLPVFVTGMAGVYQAHHSFIGPEGGVSFLILATGFKLIESQSRRDYFVLAVLDFFVLATAFLFSQSLLLAAYIGLASIGIVAALTSLQQAADVNTGHTIKKASAMALQAIPLMLVLFVFFPRLPPLWSFNLSQGTGRTGMSDSMSPGDIAKLSESSALAFRVEFQGAAPPANQLYWRGLILSHFDGQRWTQSEPISWPLSAMGLVRPKWLGAVPEGAKPIQYRVILEASDQPWLFSLAVPSSSTKKVLFTRDFRLAYQTPVFTRLSYDVISWSDQKTDKEGLPIWMQQQNLQLPSAGNPEARRMATRWRLAAASDAAYMQQILSFFREERFFYTLEPPLLGENRIDDFLFKTRRGFCEHYASAFVFMMRAAGIPARVVAGYQGGEKSPLDNYWLVRQLDAHAWAEVWLPGQGWVRADPTSMVAPERIERGATELANQPAYWGNTGIGILRHSSFRWLHSLRNMADYVNYRWYRDVLGYDSSRQEGFMRRLLGDSSLLRQLGLMGCILALLAGLSLAWALYGGRQHQHRVDVLYRRYCKRMERRGYARQPNETPQHFAQRLAKEQPKLAKEAIAIAKVYNALRYRPASQHHHALEKRLKQLARGW